MPPSVGAVPDVSLKGLSREEAKTQAEAKFRARLAELGAVLLEPYKGSDKLHHVRCAEGHDCFTRPYTIGKGEGPCGTCSKIAFDNRKKAAQERTEAEFRALLEELGVTLLEPYKGSHEPHRARCAAGHECFPRPGNLRLTGGPCKRCGVLATARRKNERTEAAFRARLEELGGVLLEPFHGGNQPHLVLCPAGHVCSPRPNGILCQGNGLCRVCAKCDPATSEAAFLAFLAAAGATSLEPAWTGARRPHRLRCAEGHVVDPQPGSILSGTGICRVCSKRDPETTEAAFRTALDAMGAVLLEPYKRAARPHHVRCASGHDCYPQPSNVLYGGAGICWTCRGRNWDVFYVLTDTGRTRIKFGKTNRSGKQRLGDHRRDGYTQVIRLLTNLPGTMATDIENAVIRRLRRAGMEPIRGREYYDIGALPLVLAMADSPESIPQSERQGSWEENEISVEYGQLALFAA